jgi:hypothetical protein
VTDYLSRFFSLLDVSSSIFVRNGSLLKWNYWLEDDIPGITGGSKPKTTIPSWPVYDPEGVSFGLYDSRQLISSSKMRTISTFE